MNPDQNPYQVPQADIAPMDQGEFHEPRSTPMGHGTEWISQAWDLFKISPGMWIAMLIVFAACQVVLGLVPFAGSLFGPVFMAGLYRASQTAHEEGVVRMEDLFAGFRERLGTLILVGLLTIVFIAITIIGSLGIAWLVMGRSFVEASGAPDIVAIFVFAAVVAALIIPVLMMTWFAPALVIFEGMAAFESMKYSFTACLRNIMPMTVYSIIAILLLIVGVLPAGLGLLVVIPLLMITMYTSYQDIFIAND